MSETRGNRSRETSGWKWAFFILLVLVGSIVFWIGWQLRPTEQSTQSIRTEGTAVAEGDELVFELTSNRQQLNQVVNVYLSRELGDDFSGYTFTIDENVELSGTIQVVNFDVDFSLYMDPFVMEDGNLQLRATSIQLGAFELPTGLAMNVISQQLELPDWVRINSEEQIILVALSEFRLGNGARLRMNRIDLEADDITIDIVLPDEAIR
ncbi:YfaA [Alkalibacterium sp. AK22]|uniref:YpmS family protein n=1 Tax=Alkalibacterium sp. AK22 TaxID=1229520 RepID=UPI00044B5F00|nr:YpmS family protein [Alkalibacterium sp. AK22]EXJ22605.1 YfaA [Alkalibacterium sp. AK22]